MQAQYRPRHDAQRSFAADEELFEIIAGVILLHGIERGDDRPVSQHSFESDDQFPHHAISQHPVSARVGRYIAADSAGASSANVEREKKACRVGRLLNRFKHRSAFDQDGCGCAVHRAYFPHAFKRQEDTARHGGRAPGEAGPATLRHHRHAVRITCPQYGRDVLRRARPCERGRMRALIPHHPVPEIARVDFTRFGNDVSGQGFEEGRENGHARHDLVFLKDRGSMGCGAANRAAANQLKPGGGMKPPSSRSTNWAKRSVVRSSRNGPCAWMPTGRPPTRRLVGMTVDGSSAAFAIDGH